ncbi:MAG: 3-dehydroquinate synthase [Alphaproteobacteria bacterium]
MTDKKISLTLPDKAHHHSYDIIVGCDVLSKIEHFIDSKHIKGKYLPLVIDAGFAKHHGDEVIAILTKKFPEKKIIPLTIEAGEASKSLSHYSDLMEKILSLGLERDSWLLAAGGGVVGDLAGFCAATLLRGICFIQIPTSLLAMVDSSVGGKTGINAKVGKNLIGAFHQPSLVLADMNFLKTLPRADISAGIAEIIKYGAIMNEEFFSYLETNMTKLMAGDTTALSYAIEMSIKMKADVVMQDEKENSYRMVLNFGHTFAHAIEAEYQYKSIADGGILHGQAVGLGMLLAADFSEYLGRAKNIKQRLKHLLQQAKLPTDFGELPKASWSIDKLIAHMQHDKKISDQQLVFILLNHIGKVMIDKTISLSEVKSFLAKYYI